MVFCTLTTGSLVIASPDAPPRSDVSAPDHKLIESLGASHVYQEFQRAFETTTRLPLTLRAPGAGGLPHHGHAFENKFCRLMAAHRKSCGACYEAQDRLQRATLDRATTVKCFAGFHESSIPVRLGAHVVACLQTGQMRSAYLGSRVVEPKHYEAFLRMLSIFAEHLAAISNQVVTASGELDSPVIQKAKAHIADHLDEEVTLERVARLVNTSACYFCKLFRRGTGLHFVDYIARLRVEKVKALLLNPHTRISEAAFAAGFQSLSQFNRIFKRVVGEQPRVWREEIRF